MELVALRVAAVGIVSGAIGGGETAAPEGTSTPFETRPVLLDGAWSDVAVYRRSALAGAITGPALVEEDYTTILLGPGWTCEPGPMGALVARKN